MAGLVPITWRKSVRTTVSDPKVEPFKNLLRQDFRADKPNQKWVSDFTYVPTDEGWLYLCTFIDLFSRRVVGWAVSSMLDRRLAIGALRNAVMNRWPKGELIIHTDRGCQYTSCDFRHEVKKIGGIQSMSRPGTPYDNACAETFSQNVEGGMARPGGFQDAQRGDECDCGIHAVLQPAQDSPIVGLSYSG